MLQGSSADNVLPFPKSKATPELSVGIVKPTGVFDKNPVQHSVDLEMLEGSIKVQSVFYNCSSGEHKLIECIRVDGAVDEGPSHDEVQFLWTVQHLFKPTVATLVTARSSVSSYLNHRTPKWMFSLGTCQLIYSFYTWWFMYRYQYWKSKQTSI